MAAIGCGVNTAHIYTRGGGTKVMDLPNLSEVAWERVRDDKSTAHAKVGVDDQCCNQLAEIKCIIHELHIFRNGKLVWVGPITRIEYRMDEIEFWATDILWVAAHTALAQGYSHRYVHGVGGIADAGAVMYWLMRDQTFSKYGDPWRARDGVRWIKSPDEPRTVNAVNAWSKSTFEDFDQYAQRGGMDYTVIGRSVLFWDIHLRWLVIPPLSQSDVAEQFKMVEYGSQFQTRGVVTNGEGKAGIYTVADKRILDVYGYVDQIVNMSSGEDKDDDTMDESEREQTEVENVASWSERAKRVVDAAPVPPLYLVVPENATLLPHAPYDVDMLVPGAWLQVDTTGYCRKPPEVWHRIDRVEFRDDSGTETITLSLIPAPAKMVTPV